MISKQEIIERAKQVHGDKYDYSITEDSVPNLGCKIHYICKEHGIIEQILHNHLQGKGCKQCANISRKKIKTMTLPDFLEKASKTHSDLDKYDWTDVDLSQRDEKGRVRLKCKEHGYFMIRPAHFINGVGCQYCSGRKKDYEKLKEELKRIHPTLDFSNSTFGDINTDYAVTYVCPKHGQKSSRLYNLLHGEGCYECAMEQNGLNQMIKMDEFLERSALVHDLNKFSFEKTDLTKRDEKGKVIITCLKHGDFKITPRNFMAGHGCNQCAIEKHAEKKRLKKEDILAREKEIFGNKYEILNIDEYVNAKTPMKIKCNECGHIFESNMDNHLKAKNGCPYCSQTSLEQIIDTVLKENNIKYIYRAKRKTIPWIKTLEIDFYLPEYNIGIECQGGQHFYSVPLWGGEENLIQTLERDKLKKQLCEENHVDLIYFSKENEKTTYQVYTDPKQIVEYIFAKKEKLEKEKS